MVTSAIAPEPLTGLRLDATICPPPPLPLSLRSVGLCTSRLGGGFLTVQQRILERTLLRTRVRDCFSFVSKAHPVDLVALFQGLGLIISPDVILSQVPCFSALMRAPQISPTSHARARLWLSKPTGGCLAVSRRVATVLVTTMCSRGRGAAKCVPSSSR